MKTYPEIDVINPEGFRLMLGSSGTFFVNDRGGRTVDIPFGITPFEGCLVATDTEFGILVWDLPNEIVNAFFNG
jgi:hypothetical protein